MSEVTTNGGARFTMALLCIAGALIVVLVALDRQSQRAAPDLSEPRYEEPNVFYTPEPEIAEFIPPTISDPPASSFRERDAEPETYVLSLTPEQSAAFDIALKKEKEKDYIGAVSGFIALLGNFPNEGLLHNHIAGNFNSLGVEFANKRMWPEAIVAYNKALDYEDNPKIRQNLGVAHYEAGDRRQAAEALLPLAASPHISEEAYKILGLIAYEMELLDDATDFWDNYYKWGGTDPQIRKSLAKAKKEQYVQKDYRADDTGNFIILYNSRRDGEAGLSIRPLLNEAYRVICRRFDFYPEKPTTVIIHSEEEFIWITGSAKWVGAVYDGKIRIPAKNLVPGSEAARDYVFHEFTHAIVHAICGKNAVPLWLNEGLACNFENKSERQFRKTFEMLLDINRLESLGLIGFSLPKARTAEAATEKYAESYFVVRYMLDRFQMHTIKRILEEIGKGKTGKRALEHVIFRDEAALLDEAADYWRKRWGIARPESDKVNTPTPCVIHFKGKCSSHR